MDLDALRYPPSICTYEMDCGIVRQEMNGMVYIACDWRGMSAKLDKAKERRDNDYKLWLFSKTTENFAEWLRPREKERKERAYGT